MVNNRWKKGLAANAAHYWSQKHDIAFRLLVISPADSRLVCITTRHMISSSLLAFWFHTISSGRAQAQVRATLWPGAMVAAGFYAPPNQPLLFASLY
jgi:hypothetical protein